MNIYIRIYFKLYYLLANFILTKESVILPPGYLDKKNIFIYFDYEREFGGNNIFISDKDIIYILDILDQYNIKTTWFTIGKIFEHYPETIKEIIKRGHEVGSHSYMHRAPVKTLNYQVRRDFEDFKKVSEKYVNVKGFHSPNGKWDLSMLKHLKRQGFLYDVIYQRNDENENISFIGLWCKKWLLRFYTLGDDWALLYRDNLNKEEAFDHFLSLYSKLKPGKLRGIGFHPWVLFTNDSILEGFKMFLQYLSQQNSINIHRAEFYAIMCLKER